MAQEPKRKKLILISGLPGSGKSTFAGYLASAGTKVLSMGDIVRDEALKRGIGSNISSMADFMIWLRKQRGEQYVAEVVSKKVEKFEDEVVVIDGVRSLAEVSYFKSKFGKVLLVAIVSSLQERFNRLRLRGRRDDPRTLDDLRMRDNTELSAGVGKVIESADIVITNDGTLDDMWLKAKQVLDVANDC